MNIVYAGRFLIFFTLSFLSTAALFPSGIHAGELERFKDMEGKISIAGGTAHLPVMIEAANRIENFNSRIKITIEGGGSDIGIQKVGEGHIEIGNSGRSLADEEREKYKLISYPFAVDGIAVAVHPDNPVSELSSEQVRSIFAGKIYNWKEVGGEDAPINLYGRDEASATRDVFWKKLLKKGEMSERINVISSHRAMKVIISMDNNAIGYMSIGHIDPRMNKGIRLDGIEPTQENAVLGKYNITRKLYMNTGENASKLTTRFIEYILSSEGGEIVMKHGFIPVK